MWNIRSPELPFCEQRSQSLFRTSINSSNDKLLPSPRNKWTGTNLIEFLPNSWCTSDGFHEEMILRSTLCSLLLSRTTNNCFSPDEVELWYWSHPGLFPQTLRTDQSSSSRWLRAEAGQHPKSSHPVYQILESFLLVGCSLAVINLCPIYFVSFPIQTCTGLFLLLLCSQFPSLFSSSH